MNSSHGMQKVECWDAMLNALVSRRAHECRNSCRPQEKGKLLCALADISPELIAMQL